MSENIRNNRFPDVRWPSSFGIKWHFRMERGSNPEFWASEEDALSTPPTPPGLPPPSRFYSNVTSNIRAFIKDTQTDGSYWNILVFSSHVLRLYISGSKNWIPERTILSPYTFHRILCVRNQSNQTETKFTRRFSNQTSQFTKHTGPAN